MAYRAQAVLKTCETKLQITFRTGGPHLVGWVRDGETALGRVTIPHGRDELTPGTESQIARSLGGKRLFNEVMACPAGRNDVVAALSERLDTRA